MSERCVVHEADHLCDSALRLDMRFDPERQGVGSEVYPASLPVCIFQPSGLKRGKAKIDC